ncbi:MAG: hypothetical protein PHS57_05560 [Alphaproteobacteria bacterium]|nr:hypothetical protein [Alphaproteobacteria bacterium]
MSTQKLKTKDLLSAYEKACMEDQIQFLNRLLENSSEYPFQGSKDLSMSTLVPELLLLSLKQRNEERAQKALTFADNKLRQKPSLAPSLLKALDQSVNIVAEKSHDWSYSSANNAFFALLTSLSNKGDDLEEAATVIACKIALKTEKFDYREDALAFVFKKALRKPPLKNHAFVCASGLLFNSKEKNNAEMYESARSFLKNLILTFPQDEPLLVKTLLRWNPEAKTLFNEMKRETLGHNKIGPAFAPNMAEQRPNNKQSLRVFRPLKKGGVTASSKKTPVTKTQVDLLVNCGPIEELASRVAEDPSFVDADTITTLTKAAIARPFQANGKILLDILYFIAQNREDLADAVLKARKELDEKNILSQRESEQLVFAAGKNIKHLGQLDPSTLLLFAQAKLHKASRQHPSP